MYVCIVISLLSTNYFYFLDCAIKTDADVDVILFL